MKVSWPQISSIFLVLSGVVFLSGLIQVVSHRFSRADNSVDQRYKTSLTERDLAIEEAIRQGKKEYSFETNFIPGMGRISDPDQHLKDWQKSKEEAPKTGS